MVDQPHVKIINNQGCNNLLSDGAQSALLYFQQALELSPSNPILLNNLGNALYNLGRLEEARTAYEQAVTAEPAYPRPYRNLGLLYQALDLPEKAVTAYRTFLALDPQDGKAWHNLGLLHQAQEQPERARHAFARAASLLTPDTAEMAANLGIGAFYCDDLPRAVELLEKALSLEPQNPLTRRNLGITYLYQGRLEEAAALLTEE